MGAPLIMGLGLFAGMLIAHVLIWRLFRPRSEIIALGVMFILAPGVFFLAGIAFVPGMASVAVVELVAAVVLYYALASAYIQTYPGFNCEIPTFKILRVIAASIPRGASYEEIAGNFNAAELQGTRVELLSRDGLVKFAPDGRPELGLAGRVLADLFIVFRKMYGLGTGKG